MRLSEAPLPNIMNISYLIIQTAEPFQTPQLLRHPLTVKKHFMEAMRLEPEGNLATTNTSNNRDSNNSHCNSHSLHACFHTCTLSIVWSEQKHHRASSCCPVSLKYWTNPNRRSKILLSQSVAERDVATYLLHVKQHIYYTSFWEQHICKSYSRCLSPLIPGVVAHCRSNNRSKRTE